MNLLNRLSVWISSLLFLSFFWLVLVQAELFYWLSVLSLVILFLTIWQLTGRQIRKSQFWFLSISPTIFLFSAWLFFLFVEGRWLRYFYGLVFTFFLFIFLQIIYLYLHRRPKYEAYALENISNYLNVFAVFLLFSGFFGLQLFLNFNIWSILLLGGVALFLLTFELFYVSNLSFTKSRLAILIIILVSLEVCLAVNYLPTSIYVDSLIVTLTYYLMSGLARNWLLNIKEKRVIIRYVIITLVCLVLILFSAKWV
ncbi:MAG: hypothetical protein JW816_01890 [Candidatus Buchananbacteria bacterium]|nr:hypothetical protein [Candidatus Buchananbacteria bacterium]